MRSIRSVRGAAAALLLVLAGATAGGSEAPVAASQARPAVDPREAALAYYRGDIEGCLRAYREVLERDPAAVEARRHLIRVLRETGRLAEALEQLHRLQSLRPGDPAVLLAAAETALFAGQPQRALEQLQFVQSSADSLYVAALALLDLGRPQEAAAALEEALERRDFLPWGWYRLGLLRLESGEAEGAEEALRRSLAQEPNLTAAFYPLARAYLALGQVPRAYGLLRRAEASRPGDPAVRSLLETLGREHPELLQADRREEVARREAARPRRAESMPAEAGSLPTLRVGLSEGVQELHLKTGGDFRLEEVGRESGGGQGQAAQGQAAQGQAGAVLTARLAGTAVEVADADGRVLARSGSALRLVYADPADTTILFDVQFGRGAYWAGSEDRTYRGLVDLLPRPEGVTVVNTLTVEEYLYSVLPSEMPSSWPQAALEAQAVAARSYTLANLGRFSSRGFDLLGSVYSAAYRGLGAETPPARAAVDRTRGLALVDGERPLAAFYCANSGGHTDTTDTAWGFASSLPAVADPLLAGHSAPLAPDDLAGWLSARPDSYSADPDYSSRSAYRWQLWVPREEIERRLEGGESLGSLRALVPGPRGASGRVRELRVLGTTGELVLRGDAIRWRMGGLRSNLFTVQPKLGGDGLPEVFVFTGGGWGHGVGLDQSGAAGMAAAGFGAEEILAHYYGGAALQRLY